MLPELAQFYAASGTVSLTGEGSPLTNTVRKVISYMTDRHSRTAEALAAGEQGCTGNEEIETGKTGPDDCEYVETPSVEPAGYSSCTHSPGSKPVNVLLVDDDKDDYVLTRDMLSEISNASYKLDWVTTYDEALAALNQSGHDICLLDYRLGQYTGLELLRTAVGKGCRAPVILLTGQGDHDVDMAAMKAGASDYLVKGQINAPLLERAIRYAIERKRNESEREKLIARLQMARADVKTLTGMLPICASCKKIRDDKGYWSQVEEYIERFADVEFSHGLCPECLITLYPGLNKDNE